MFYYIMVLKELFIMEVGDFFFLLFKKCITILELLKEAQSALAKKK